MAYFCLRKKRTFVSLCCSLAFSFAFLFNFTFLSTGVHAQLIAENTFSLPLPGAIIAPTQSYAPPIMTGVVLNPEDPLEFEFMINNGELDLDGEAFQKEAEKLIKYFLVTLTIPEEKLWVNLSPYERDQTIPGIFGETEMGRDLLAQDYLLKQLSASLMHPKDDLGKEFWERVYAKAFDLYGTKDIPVNTFNKVWIVPEKAAIYENEMGAFVLDSRLKVMLEEDYLILQKNMDNEDLGLDEIVEDDAQKISQATTEIIREIMIPEIEKEVNEGKTFANLRQIYNSMILASWYKKNLRESFLGQTYVDQNKIKGVDLEDKTVKNKIFDQYLAAFQKGVYNYLKKEFDPQTNEIVVKRYFSGGFSAAQLPQKIVSSPLERLSPKEYAFVATQMGRSSSSIAQRIRNKELKTMSPVVQRKVKIEADKFRTMMGNTSVVRAKFSPERGMRSFGDMIRAEFDQIGTDRGSSPMQMERVTASMWQATRSQPMNIKPLAGGQIRSVRNRTDEANVTRLAAMRNIPVIKIDEGGNLEVLQIGSQWQIKRQTVNDSQAKDILRDTISPIVLTSGAKAIDALDAKSPDVFREIARVSVRSLRIPENMPVGTMHVAVDTSEANSLTFRALDQNKPVIQVTESGAINEVMLGVSGEIETNAISPRTFENRMQLSEAAGKPVVIAVGDKAVSSLYSAAPDSFDVMTEALATNLRTRGDIQGGAIYVATDVNDMDTMTSRALDRNKLVVRITGSGRINEMRRGAGGEIETNEIDAATFAMKMRVVGRKPVVIASDKTAISNLRNVASDAFFEVAKASAVSLRSPVDMEEGVMYVAMNTSEANSLMNKAADQNKPAVQVTRTGVIKEVKLGDIGEIETSIMSRRVFEARMQSKDKPVVIAMGDDAVSSLYDVSPNVLLETTKVSARQNLTQSEDLSDAVRIKTLEWDVNRVISDGSSITIPDAQKTALSRRSPVFREADQIVQKLGTGQITIDQAQAGGILKRLDTEIGTMITEFNRGSSFGKKADMFYQIQAASATRDMIAGRNTSAPRFGLSGRETQAFTRGQVSNVAQLKRMFISLTKQLGGLMRIENVLSAAKTAEDKSYLSAIRINRRKVNQDMTIVNRAIKRMNKMEGVSQDLEAGKPGVRGELLQGSKSFNDVPNAVKQLSMATGPIYVLDNRGGTVKQVEAQEAVKLLENNSAVHSTPDNIIVVELSSGKRRLSASQRGLIDDFKGAEIAKVDVGKVIARLDMKPKDLGGIDLNPSLLDMRIKKDGNGVPLPMSQQPIDVMNIQGFVPVIIDVSPAIYDMPMLLGRAGSDVESDL